MLGEKTDKCKMVFCGSINIINYNIQTIYFTSLGIPHMKVFSAGILKLQVYKYYHYHLTSIAGSVKSYEFFYDAPPPVDMEKNGALKSSL